LNYLFLYGLTSNTLFDVLVLKPKVALAITLVKRLKELFLNQGSEYQLVFDTKETILVINGCLIQAFPSHHLDAMRGLTNVAVVFQDESSFFEINRANDAIDVSQRYIGKSDPYLIVVSTPNSIPCLSIILCNLMNDGR
jgi:hypothetical protein